MVAEYWKTYNGTNGTSGHTPPDAGDNGFGQYPDTHEYPEVDHAAWQREREEARKQAWMASEPPHLHSLEWRDETLGIRHMHVIRAADVDTLWLEVRKVMALVKASKAKEATHSSAPVQEPMQGQTTQPAGTQAPVQPEPCPTHGTAKLKPSKFGGGLYCAAKTADGYCSYRVAGGQ